MKKLLFTFLFSPILLFSQTVIKGKITDRKGGILVGANIFIKGSYGGASTDAEGNFSFKTSKKDTVTIAASNLGYENFEQKAILTTSPFEITIKLREAMNELNTVVITAGILKHPTAKKW